MSIGGFPFLLLIVSLFLSATRIVAGSIAVVDLPPVGTDAASEIHPTSNYLCALDFGSSVSALSVNGVPFHQINLSGVGSGPDPNHPVISGSDSNFGGPWMVSAANLGPGMNGFSSIASGGASVPNQSDGGMASLLTDISFLPGQVAVGAVITQQFGGLLIGTNYSLRLYYRQWSEGTSPVRPVEFVFNGEGTNQTYADNPLDIDGGGARYLKYDFNAKTNFVQVTMTCQRSGYGPHLYGVTLQAMSPFQPVAPIITTQPQGSTNAFGATAVLRVVANGTPPLSYQWFKSGEEISSATNATLSFGYLNSCNAGSYHVVVTNVAGADTSDPVALRVTPSPLIQPEFAQIDAQLLTATEIAESLNAAADAGQATSAWSARWIGPGTSSVNKWSCYRKTFSLPAAPGSAMARIAADSKYWLWVNGQIAVREGGLKRGPTPDDTWFDEIDLAPMLQPGSNTIAVLHWYFGKHGFSHKDSGSAGFLFEMNAEGTVVTSDSSWRRITNPAFQLASTISQPNYRLPESNLRYDSRVDPGAWTEPAFEDSGWEFAQDRGAVGGSPWGDLWRRPLPLWKESPLQSFESIKVSGLAPATWTGALPGNQQFTPWLDVDAPAGKVITIFTDASYDPGFNSVAHEYITRAGRQSFEFPAWLNGHWVKFSVPSGVTVHGLKYRPYLADTDLHGSFTCDDAALTTLWSKSANTLRVNMMDTWGDTSHERANWIGDTVIILDQTPYAFDSRSELLTRKSLLDLIYWQRPDDTMYAPVPAGNWTGELPLQVLAAVGKYGVLRYYQNTGDLAFLQQCYPAIKNYLLNVWQTNSSGLVVHRAGGWDWVDWGDNIDVPLLDNTWYLLALDAAAEMAALVGQPADAPLFGSRANGIRNQFNASFWMGSAYRSPGYSGATDERGNAMAVLAGLTQPTQSSALRQVLRTEQHCSPYMEKFVLKALFALGYPDDALARMRSRYAAMIESSSTTLWEGFPATGGFNHSWSGGPLTLLSANVGGVTFTSPGFATFDVRPMLGSTLSRADVDVPTRHGLVRVSASRNGINHRLSVRVPPGTTGRAVQPGSGNSLSGATVSIQGGASVIMDETCDPQKIEVVDGNATMLSHVNGAANLVKTGPGTLFIGASTSLIASSLEVAQGAIEVMSGGRLEASAGLTNRGTLRLKGSALLNIGSGFHNAGVLDVLTWNGELPVTLTNTGVILDRHDIQVFSPHASASGFTVTVMGYAGHEYQLQYSDNLANNSWIDAGAKRIGTGATLVLADLNELPPQVRFYRVKVF